MAYRARYDKNILQCIKKWNKKFKYFKGWWMTKFKIFQLMPTKWNDYAKKNKNTMTTLNLSKLED